MIFTGCILDDSPTGPDETVGNGLFIYETDFGTGQIERMSTTSGELKDMNVAVYKDASIYTYNGMLYVVERMGGDAVIKIDPSKKGEGAVLYQIHLGDGWNSYDLVFASDTKAYVANQNKPEITVFNPATGTIDGHIAIDKFTYMPQNNTSPYANKMAIVGKKLYVALQQRDGWVPGAPTLIIAIDTESDKLIDGDTIRCTYSNNFDMIAVGTMLYCTNPGNGDASFNGGIEKIDCTTGEVTTVLTGEKLGGNPNQIAHIEGERFYVQNYRGWQDVTIVEIDAEKGTIVATLKEIKNGYGGICYDPIDEKLYVGEQKTSGIGIMVYSNNTLVAGPLTTTTSLPPAGMVVVR